MARSLLHNLALGGVALGGAAVLGTGAAAALALVGIQRWRTRGYELAGKTVLITGGSRGLGYAIAREFLRCGSRVALVARDRAELDRAASQLSAFGPVHAVEVDLLQPDAARTAVESVRRQWGPVDVLVHAAGLMQVGPWELMSDEDFSAAMELHCWSALRLAQAVLPTMIARRDGRIVNISSIGGLVAVPHMLPYTTSKFALVGLSQGLASEVRRHGVRVTCVCPFLTRTGSQENIQVKGRHRDEFAWFATSGSLPGLSQSAQHAARGVVRACQRGEAVAVLAWPGKLAAFVHALAPSTVTAAMGITAQWLPASPPEGGSEPRRGADSYNEFTTRLIQPGIRRAGRQVNQPVG